MAIREVDFLSFNERDTVKAWVYTPLCEPKAIVQIVHGLGEHSRRYLHMILKFLDAGFIVCADDHVGHGKTAYDSNTWGDFGSKGYMTTVNDEKTLHDIVTKEFPSLPFFMFGHSWGSIIARNYASNYGSDLNGLIICGALADSEGIVNVFPKVKAYIENGKDNEVVPELIMESFAGWTDRYENPKSPNDWIALEASVVDDHSKDPFNNLNSPLNVRLLYDIGEALIMIQGQEWAKKLPANLPIYNIAGDMDPAGNYGEGTYKITRWIYESGNKNITTKVYSGFRHEIHNEPPIRDEVEDGIVSFIEKNI